MHISSPLKKIYCETKIKKESYCFIRFCFCLIRNENIYYFKNENLNKLSLKNSSLQDMLNFIMTKCIYALLKFYETI